VRVLDLGCGTSRDLTPWGVSPQDDITGLDLNRRRLELAQVRFPNRAYVEAVGEHLPFADNRFDRVISLVALPYMDIRVALGELHRVLVPGGSLWLSLHPAAFTVSELLHNALPRPLPTLFRFYVLTNGFCFHLTGRTLRFINGRTESFQTLRGMKRALHHAGFVHPSFVKYRVGNGTAFQVEAQKPVCIPAKKANVSSRSEEETELAQIA